MAFFEFMKKMVEGKPVFEDGSTKEDTNKPSDISQVSPAVGTDKSAIRKHEDGTFPVVEIRQVKTHLDGNNIQIYCHIRNEWEHEVMLDKIRLLGTKRELDTSLRGGEDREFLVYKGPKLQHEYHEAEIDYKTAREGDYFQAVYHVTFTYNTADKSYTINEMELDLPIRDIYE
jgi:hypothetical protein